MSTYSLGSPRLTLEFLARDLARLIVDGAGAPDWGEGFPAPGEVKASTWVLTDAHGGVQHAPFLPYVIREQKSGLLIGGAGFHGRPEERSIEVGYGLSPAYRGMGYATEACCTLAAAAFASGCVDALYARTLADNAASQSVLRRAGFIATDDFATYWTLLRPSS